MKYRVWYSTETFADYIISKTALKNKVVEKQKLYESDANNGRNFHAMPDHIKQILYLDAPDIIVELNTEPIFSIEESKEAGTGHNAFQRFARLAASVENNVPAFYIYPEAAIITRQNSKPKWDPINALIFKALDKIMTIYKIPVLLYYFPSDFKSHPTASTSPRLNSKGLRYEKDPKFAGCPDSGDSEMKALFEGINEIISTVEKEGIIDGREKLLGKLIISDRKDFMRDEYARKGGNENMSPLSSTLTIPTKFLLNYLEKSSYNIGELLRGRPFTVIYKMDAAFRGDPYPGALAAIDYLKCREGKTFEERGRNLVLAWGDLAIDEKNETLVLSKSKSSITDFVAAVKSSEKHNLLSRSYHEIAKHEIPRYYMQVRYGSTFSKVKHIRVYSYFADAILFNDGALWRDA
jgi:hypothetical protein